MLHTQIPTALDDVFFDANSFPAPGQVVTLNALTILVNDMNWTGATNNPTLAGTNAILLKIYGSLTLINAMNLPFAGAFSFEATTTGKTINSAGKTIPNTISFNGTGGGWTLLNNLSCSNIISLNSGTLNTNNQAVNATQFYSSVTATRGLDMGSSVFTLSSGTCWNVSVSSGLVMNCGTSTINATASNAGFSGGGLTYNDLNFAAGGGIADNNIFHNVSFGSDGTIIDNNSFNNVSFARNGTIYGNNIFNNLSFTPGYSYVLRSGQTQTINNLFSATGNCGALIAISATLQGSQTTISHPPGAVTVSFVTLKDINTTGGASFTANNAVDLGNNTGWTMNVAASKDLYWIGNGGNWNDGNHWSLSSGGPPSGCSPTPIDNVFFDANSYSLPGQATTINIPTAYCRNMNWTGATNNPTLAGAFANQLKIYGSLTFVPNMTMLFAGTVNLEATTTGQTITSAGKSFSNAITFNGVGGGWTLQDALSCTNTIFINNGIVNSNDQTVNAIQVYSNSIGAKTLNMGASVFNLAGGTFWNVSGITLNSGTSTINSTGTNSNFYGGGLVYYDMNLIGGGTINDDNFFHNVNFVGNSVISGNNSFNNAVFSRNGTILTNNVFNNLSFTAGFTYTIRDAKVQTVNAVFSATGNCGALIAINSSVPGNQATISHPPGAVTISFVTLKDINAAGGAVFTANNTIDLGNNTGWTINPATAKDLYWIGNGGNWNDGNHWSLSSGGPPSGCSPTPIDNVFFDANSYSLPGQATTINVPTAYCRDMNWTGATNTPTFSGPFANQLKIFGSLNFIPAMLQQFLGTVSFEATSPGKTITCAGRSFNNAIGFNGAGGWTLQDVLTVNNILNFNNGTLNTNNQTVNATQLYSNSLVPRTLNMGSSVFNLSGATPWNIASPSGLVVNCGTSLINASIAAANATFIGGGLTYYDLDFVNPSMTFGGIIDNNVFHNVNFASDGTINDNNSFNNVVFHKNGTMYGSNSFTNLTFTAGYTYLVRNGKTQTITDKWLIQGSCTSYIILQSTTPGSPAAFSKPAGTVTGFNIHIRDINCTGGANFMAYNSVDLGGNSGWNFSTLPPLSNPGDIIGPATVCLGQTGVTYYINPTPGAISYTWTVPPGATITSGQGDTLITVDFTAASSGNITVTAFSGCAFSNPGVLAVVVGANFLPAVSIVANPGASICSGTSVSFTATATNGGATPSYQWQVNGVNAGANSPIFTTSTLANGDIVTVILSSSLGCAAPPSATSNAITMTVNASAAPAVNITATPGTVVCAGTSVSFTAAPTNGGSAPSYQWQVNGLNAGTNAASFTTGSLLNGDIVRVVMTSNSACASPVNATSNIITMTVNANVAPAVNITANPGASICTGSNVTFSAVPTNGGATPSFQWQVNGINAGTGSSTFTTNSLLNGDIVTVIMTSTAACVFPATAISNGINMAVSAPSIPSVNIIASATAVCSGASVVFTATPVNGGTAPSYQWKINGINTGTNAAIFTTTALANGDIVTVIMTSNAACVSPVNATSNAIAITVLAASTASLNVVTSASTICSGDMVTFTAIPLNAGPSPDLQWRWNGNNVGSNIPSYVTSNLANGDKISCIMSGFTGCPVSPFIYSDTVSMTVNPLPVISFTPANPSVLSGNSVQLHASVSGNVTGYLWTPSTTLNLTSIPNPIANPVTTTSYNLKVVSTDNCVASKNLTVTVLQDIYIPNSFTPNGNGKNDIFRIPPGTSFVLRSFSVYDRYGNQLFQTSDINKGWDGTYKGARSPNGSYTYLIKGYDYRRDVVLSGSVVLIR